MMKPFLFLKLLGIGVFLAATQAKAAKRYYSLDSVFLSKEGPALNLQEMSGFFSWEYTPGDFENGTGTFLYLDIPGTSHDQLDLTITFDTGSIEFTLEGDFHDDGVDLTLRLLEPLSPDGPAAIDTERSKFDIGGNGFYAGTIDGGSFLPFEFKMKIDQITSTTANVSWTPNYPGSGLLQESSTLAPGSWSNSSGGNPLTVSTTESKMFYRLVLP